MKSQNAKSILSLSANKTYRLICFLIFKIQYQSQVGSGSFWIIGKVILSLSFGLSLHISSTQVPWQSPWEVLMF